MILGILLTIAALIATGFFAVLWLVGKSAVTQEASNVFPDATRSLIVRAMDRLPEDARKRYEEEWLAGFEEAIEKRPIWAFREAVSLYRGAGRIARELAPAPEPAARGQARVGLTADAAVARASGIFTQIRQIMDQIRQTIDRLSHLVDLMAYRIEEYFRRFYGLYGLDYRIQAQLGRLLRMGSRLLLILLCFLLAHNVLGWI